MQFRQGFWGAAGAAMALSLIMVMGCGDGGSGGGMLVGRVDSMSSTGQLRMALNGQEQDVEVEQGVFAEELPTGDVVVEIERDGVRGQITVTDVQPGEVIEVSVSGDGGALVIRVERRTVPEPAPADGDGPLVLASHHQVVQLGPGVHRRDIIITGHHIVLLGDCDEGTIIEGDLIIEGHHAVVLGLEVTGRVDFARGSHHVRYSPTCSWRDHGEHHRGPRRGDDRRGRDRDDDKDDRFDED